jgi:tetratricopeptide (TPR) repeat protein
VVGHDRNEEDAVNDLIEQSDMARLRGATELALGLRIEAVERAEALSDQFPDDPRHLQTMAAALYAIGQIATDVGELVEAVEALDDCQALYEKLGQQDVLDPAPFVCDVAARRARALSRWGRGASAVVDADRAVRGYRRLTSVATSDDPAHLDLARVLSAAAVVQLQFGDPDLAVGAADSAIRIYLNRDRSATAADDLLVHGNYLAEALVVAELVHGVHGRAELSSTAGTYLSQMISRAERRAAIREAVTTPSGTLLGDRAPLSSTLAEALSGSGLGELASELTLPAVECAITVPSERCSLERVPAAGARLARSVAGLAEPADELRVGLEAHWLLAAALETDAASLKLGFGDLGLEWLRALRACGTLLEDAGETDFALDLMSWAAGVGQRLTPFALKPATAREICDCFEQHARLLELTGDAETADQARHAAKQLRRVFPHTG